MRHGDSYGLALAVVAVAMAITIAIAIAIVAGLGREARGVVMHA